MALDASGKLYYVKNGTLYRAQPDGSGPVAVLPNTSIKAFTLGDGRNTFIETVVSGALAIEEFAPGSTAPERVITGNATKLGPATTMWGRYVRH